MIHAYPCTTIHLVSLLKTKEPIIKLQATTKTIRIFKKQDQAFHNSMIFFTNSIHTSLHFCFAEMNFGRFSVQKFGGKLFRKKYIWNSQLTYH